MRHPDFLAALLATLLLIGGCGDDGNGNGSPSGNDSGGSGAAATVSGFDPNNRDRAALWWAELVKELVQARTSGNEIQVADAIEKINAARAPLVGQRIRFLFNVWTTNPDLPETVWNYKQISSEGVWVGLLHRANPGRIRVGVINRGRGAAPGQDGVRAFLLKPGEHIDAAVLRSLSDRSTFEISATITRTGLDRFNTWHSGMKQFGDPPTLLLFIDDIKVEKVNP